MKKKTGKEVDMKSNIAREVGKAKIGTGKLRITFKKDAIDILDEFCELDEKGAIMMSDSCAAILAAAKVKGYWGHVSNRIITIGLGINFNINRKEFREALAGAIENIEAVKKAKKGG
jgi:hypothetical protein